METKPTTTLVYHLEGLNPYTNVPNPLLPNPQSYGPDVNELVLTVRAVAGREWGKDARGVDNLPLNHAAGYYVKPFGGENLDAILIFNVDSIAKGTGTQIGFPSTYIERGVEELTGYLREAKISVIITKKAHVSSDRPPLDDHTLMQMLGLI